MALSTAYPTAFIARTLAEQVVVPLRLAADEIEIQSALNMAALTGGVVSLPPGNYTLAAGITMGSNVTLRGAGVNATKLTWTDGGFHRVQNSDTVSGNSYLGIEQLTMDFGGVSGSDDFHGVRFQAVTDFRMSDVELKNAPHHNLVSFDGGSDVNARWYIRDSVSDNAGQRTATDGDGFRVAAGFQQTAPEDGATLTACRARGNSHHGFHLGAAVEAVACSGDTNGTANGYMAGHFSKIIGGNWTNPTEHNILIDGGQHGGLSDAFIDGSGGSGFDAVFVDTTVSTGLTITGNKIINSQRDAIRTEASEVIITGNFLDGGTSGIVGVHVIDASRVLIDGNLITDFDQSAARGVFLEIVAGAVARVTIKGNEIYSNGTGIFIEDDAGVSNIWIDGNMLDGNTTTNLNDAGGKATIGSDFSGLTSKYALA